MKLFNKAAEAVKGARAKAAGVGAGLMVAAGSAMATPTAATVSGSPETSGCHQARPLPSAMRR